MRFIEEYRDGELAQGIAQRLSTYTDKKVNLMEVCGTHTVSVFRHGLRSLLPPNVNMLSGPGCPVCVTANADLDKAIALANMPGVVLATFGDMLKVPGSYSSLQKVKAEGGSVRLVYSPLEALKLAQGNPTKKVVFFAVGFETTAPTIACTVLEAKRRGMENLFIVSVHKLVPPALGALLDAKEVRIDGFLCPGHVSAIIGSHPYEFVAQDYGIPCVIGGFEPVDILQAIEMLLKQIARKEAKVDIQYRRGVPPEGNKVALEYMAQVFEPAEAEWRGLGVIPSSGLKVRESFAQYDAERMIEIHRPKPREHQGCRCGDVLRGAITPPGCSLFGRACNPEHPIGPCMVSFEGTCSAWYQYGGAE